MRARGWRGTAGFGKEVIVEEAIPACGGEIFDDTPRPAGRNARDDDSSLASAVNKDEASLDQDMQEHLRFL